MRHLNKIKSLGLLIGFSVVTSMNAQTNEASGIHDATKMNQITIQEVGVGGFTPAFYYDLFHQSYQKTAANKNKLTFRTLASVAAYQQLDDADSIQSSLTKRAEIEALNVADRQVDVAWATEGTKITKKLESFKNNINRIMDAGGRVADRNRWSDYYHIFETAVKITQDAYMPNAQRKKEYLAIYADISKQNENLIAFLVQTSKKSKTTELLSATYTKPDHRSVISSAAHERWSEVGRKVKSSTTAEKDDEASDVVIIRE